jgi:hypothetical protein
MPAFRFDSSTKGRGGIQILVEPKLLKGQSSDTLLGFVTEGYLLRTPIPASGGYRPECTNPNPSFNPRVFGPSRFFRYLQVFGGSETCCKLLILLIWTL